MSRGKPIFGVTALDRIFLWPVIQLHWRWWSEYCSSCRCYNFWPSIDSFRADRYFGIHGIAP